MRAAKRAQSAGKDGQYSQGDFCLDTSRVWELTYCQETNWRGGPYRGGLELLRA